MKLKLPPQAFTSESRLGPCPRCGTAMLPTRTLRGLEVEANFGELYCERCNATFIVAP